MVSKSYLLDIMGRIELVSFDIRTLITLDAKWLQALKVILNYA